MARDTAEPETGEVGESCVLCTERAELLLLRTALLLSCLESQGKLEPMSSQSGRTVLPEEVVVLRGSIVVIPTVPESLSDVMQMLGLVSFEKSLQI